MGWVIPLLSFIGGLMFLALIIVFNAIYSGKDKKYTARPNMPFIDLSNSKLRTSIIGYGRGLVEQQLPKPNGTVFFKIYPDDVLQGENVTRPDFKLIVIGNGYIKRYAEGEKYPRRQAIEIFPLHRHDMPKSMRNSRYGKYLEAEGQKAFVEAFVERGTDNMHKSIKEISDTYAFGELTNIELRKMKEKAEKKEIAESQTPEVAKK